MTNPEMLHDNDRRAPWVAPEMVELQVTETQGFPRRGIDAAKHADCTRS